MAADTYQAVSPIQTLIYLKIFRHFVTTEGLAFLFTAVADPDFWEPLFALMTYTPMLSEASFRIDERQYGVGVYNCRVTPAMDLLSQLPDSLIAMAPGIPPINLGDTDQTSLSQAQFAEAVQQALRDFVRPDALRHNPLLHSRLVSERAGSNAPVLERIVALQALLQEVIESLQRSPREAKFYRALSHTYLQPANTQEQAAEALDISIATFRRHLKAGINSVTEILWHHETEDLEN